jgi:subtilase family serine protease
MHKYVGIAVLLVFAAWLSPMTVSGQQVAQAGSERVCPIPTIPHMMACTAHRLIVSPNRALASADLTTPLPAGFSPADLQDAYALTAFSATVGSGRTIAIVVAQDGPTAEADLAIYRSTFGLPPCTTANGCFRKVNQAGAPSPLPTPDSGWASESNLQLDVISAMCPNCNLLLVEATTATDDDLGTAVNTAAAQPGVAAISNPYGGTEESDNPFANTILTACELHYHHPGIAVTASSGDSGYGVEFPASCNYVTAVGGTSLARSSDPSNTRGWSETVWNSNGGAPGSGCSAYIAKPSWQTDTGCAMRTVADVAAVADPSTGLAVYDQGSWSVFGGTSTSVAVVTGVYGLASPAGAGDLPVSYAYANPSALFDITQGTNVVLGTPSCSGNFLYLCKAGIGYDGPTGFGTPNGVAAFGPPTGNDFSLFDSPASISLLQGTSGNITIATAVTAGSAQSLTLAISGLPSGATATPSPGAITSGNSATLAIDAGTAAAGIFTLTVTATGTATTHSATLSLTITSPPANDFSIAATPSSLTLVQGQSGSSTIATSIISGNAQSVNLSVLGLPTGANANLSPATITSGGSSVLTLNAGTAVPGTYSLTILGTGTSNSHSSAVTLIVTPIPADFSLSATPSTHTQSQGSIGLFTISVKGIAGFAGSVALSVTGLPSKIIGTAIPKSVSGSGTSYLICLVGLRAPRGSFALTITGTSGSLSHSINVTLVVQ